MATLPIKKGCYNAWRMRNGGPPTIKHFLEADSSTFVAGDWVYITSNVLTHAAHDTSSFCGMALADANNTTGTSKKKIPVLVFTEDLELQMQIHHATAASATLTDGSSVGTSYDVLDHAAGIWMVDLEDTSHTRVTVIEYSADDYGDIYMPVWVSFIHGSIMFP